MISVQILDPVKDSRWDRFVEGNPNGWICHLSSWQRVLENSFEHIKGYCLALVDSENNLIQAGLPIFHVKSWLLGNRLVAAPFATLFDPLAANDNHMKLLLGRSIQLARDLKSSYVEIRTLHTGPIFKGSGLEASLVFRHHYLDLNRSLDDVWKGFHRQSIRHKISKALKNNINVRVAESEDDLKKFYRLHLIARKRLALPPQPFKFFNSLWQNFYASGRLFLILASKNNTPMSGLICFRFKDRVSAEYLATDNQFLNLNPNHLLYWEAIQMAHGNGFSIFDLGRTSSFNTSLMAFKGKWGANVIDLPTFYYPPEVSKRMDRNEVSLKYKALKMICRNMPDSLQQVLGSFVYKHLG